ncbi:lipocalin family protein [Xylanibacter brevis]|uniref:lipocalin family protein n=1 Tax=Xylanibacter brevis TaxID=83231 RepID=UPI000693E8F6|nr:lipocalin family protein [Xylanibacter brevis]
MKKTVIFVMAAILAIGCGGSKKANFSEDLEAEEELDAYRDSTIYGFCTDKSTGDILQIITDAGDTLNINVANARENGDIKGGYNKGDEMAVVANGDSTIALLVINKTALLGNWVMPNPIDGSSETGISIRRSGSVEGIDQNAIIYKSWRIYNGKLQITSTREDGVDVDETFIYSIKRITPDSLVIQDAEETFEYSRQKEVVEEELGIELDNGDDDFMM